MKTRLWWGFPLLLLLLLLSGCPPKGQLRVINDQDKALSQLLARQNTVNTIEGSAKLRIYEKGKRRRTIRLLFQIQRPAKINFQLLGLASQPALLVTSDGKRFAVHNLLNGEFRRGPSKRLTSQLGGILPRSLSMKQLVPILLGQIPLIASAKRSWSKAGALHTLRLTGKNEQQKLVVDFQKQRFVSGFLKKKGQQPLELSYGGVTGKGRLPRAIRVKAKGHNMRFSWIFLDVDVNPKLKGNPFVRKPPKGATVLDM